MFVFFYIRADFNLPLDVDFSTQINKSSSSSPSRLINLFSASVTGGGIYVCDDMMTAVPGIACGFCVAQGCGVGCVPLVHDPPELCTLLRSQIDPRCR
jgi:hypothetical protein